MLNAIHPEGALCIEGAGAGAATLTVGLRRRAVATAAERIAECRIRITPERNPPYQGLRSDAMRLSELCEAPRKILDQIIRILESDMKSYQVFRRRFRNGPERLNGEGETFV